MSIPFDTVNILPSYETGFTFLWTVSPGFSDPAPWLFHVEEGHSVSGPWHDLSGELEDSYAWTEPTRRRIQPTKDPTLFFRVTLTTPEETYVSHIKTPYGDLNRREYLIVQDLMRRVILEQKYLAGVAGKLWCKASWGPKCTVCTDPISGSITDSSCPVCLGTGRVPPYHGPYDVWVTLSPQQRDKQQSNTGPKQQYSRGVRMVGFPSLKDDDIIVDPEDDKRYIVDGVQNQTEIRKVPVIQQATAHELPTSDPAYKLGG